METITIPLNRGFCTVIDAADYPLVQGASWRVQSVGNGQFYAATSWDRGSARRDTVLMHRLIMDAPTGSCVDHINGDKMDNRRANLRLCTRRQNNCNTPQRANNKSGFKGISRHSKNEKWIAQIHHEGRAIYLGSFDDAAEAARIYDAAAMRLHGAFAWLNFPTEMAA